MFVHTVDISTVDEGYVTWLRPNTTEVRGDASDETYFYGLTEGSLVLLAIDRDQVNFY